MLTIVKNENEIRKVQIQLESKMKDVADKHGDILLGGKGWHQTREVYWNRSLDVWWTMTEEQDSYWNSFGIGEPRWNTRYPHSITCEINTPKGKNQRFQGVIARDESNNIYLLHRGRIGGGREGIGKSLFIDNFRGEWETVRDGNLSLELALIAALHGERFPQQLADFVHEVKRIKDTAFKRSKPTLTIRNSFKEEFSGKKKFSQPKEIETKCDHGLVVNNLANRLESKGLTVGNNSQMDLYVLGKNKEIERLFEIKTDTTIRSCCQAIGQLFFYSSRLSQKPLLSAVFPQNLAKEYKDVFEKLGINVVKYAWVDNQPRFSSSNSI